MWLNLVNRSGKRIDLPGEKDGICLSRSFIIGSNVTVDTVLRAQDLSWQRGAWAAVQAVLLSRNLTP
jgi:hypothetical protein